MIHVQVNYNTSPNYRRIFIRGTKDIQLVILNKGDADRLGKAVYKEDHLSFESEINIKRDQIQNDRVFLEDKGQILPFDLDKFESRQLYLKDSDEKQEFYYDNSISDQEESRQGIRFTETNLTPVISR